MPQRICATAGCPNPVTYRGRCNTHARDREREINRAGKALYSTKRWQLTRRKKLGMNPICEWDGCTELASDVHHVVSIEAGGAVWAMQNLSAMCHSHHSILTRREQMV